MDYRPLGKTDLQVSVICLGTMTWGQQNSEADAHAQLDLALDRGVNFVDAAEMYPTPPKAETQGLTETYIGTWLAARKNRDRVVLASKVTGRSSNFPYFGRGETRLNREQINAALEVAHRQPPQRAPGRPASQRARVVLDARAGPGLSQHLQVEPGPLLDALRLQQLALAAEELQLLLKLLLYVLQRLAEGFSRVDIHFRVP